MHVMQNLIVALLVPGCTLYAAWKLAPSSARRSMATAMLRWPHLPGPVERRLRRSVKAASGCGCDGCDRAEGMSKQKPAASPQTITFHPRPKR